MSLLNCLADDGPAFITAFIRDVHEWIKAFRDVHHEGIKARIT